MKFSVKTIKHEKTTGKFLLGILSVWKSGNHVHKSSYNGACCVLLVTTMNRIFVQRYLHVVIEFVFIETRCI